MVQDDIERELERLHQESFGWAMSCCGRRPDEAEDVLQTSYVKILNGSAKFQGRSSFRTWLFGVIRRTAMQKRRKFAVRGRILRHLFEQQSEHSPAGPEITLENSMRAQRLIKALNALSNRQGEILQLVFYHEMSIETAAEVLGISIGSARTHYARGKKNLAGRLMEHENE